MWAFCYVVFPLCCGMLCLFLFVYYSCAVLSMPTGLPGGRTHKHTSAHAHTQAWNERQKSVLVSTNLQLMMVEVAVIPAWLNPCPHPGVLAPLGFCLWPCVPSFSFLLSLWPLSPCQSMSLCLSQRSCCVIFRPGLGLVHCHTVSYGRYVSSQVVSWSTVENTVTDMHSQTGTNTHIFYLLQTAPGMDAGLSRADSVWYIGPVCKTSTKSNELEQMP